MRPGNRRWTITVETERVVVVGRNGPYAARDIFQHREETTMHVQTRGKKLGWGLLAILAAILAGSLWPALALIGDVPTVHLTIPALAANSRIRLAGTWVRESAAIPAPPPIVELRLRLIDSNDSMLDFSFPATVIPDKSRPNHFALMSVIEVSQTGFFAPGTVGSGAVITELEELVGRGYRGRVALDLAAYIEQDNAQGNLQPPIAPYVIDKDFDVIVRFPPDVRPR